MRTGYLGRLWLVYLAVGLVAIAAYFALPSVAAQNVAYDAIGFSAVVAIIAGVSLHRPAHRLPWFLLALGDGLAVGGDLLWTIDENVRGIAIPFPSFADVLYLSGYVIFFAGVVLLIRIHKSSPEHAAIIDTAILATAVGAVIWIFLIAPHMADPGRPLITRLVASTYPAVDLLVLAAAVRLVLGLGWQTVALRLLILALAANFVADIAFAILTAQGRYQTGHPIDAGWLVAYLLHGVLALHPSMRDRPVVVPDQEAALPPGRLPLLALAALTGPALLAVQTARGEAVAVPVVVGTSALLSLLALGRLRLLTTELRRREARFHALVRHSSDIVAVVDPEGLVRYVSAAIRPVLGYNPAELLQRPLADLVHPDDFAAARLEFARLRERASRSHPFELRLRAQAGVWRQVEMVGTNLLDEPSVGGIVINCRDITARRLAEAALLESEAELATAQRIAGLGNWTWRRAWGGVRCSTELFRLFGYTPGAVVPRFRRFLATVHPDDRQRVRRWARRLYRGEATGIEHRIVWPDGSIRVVQHQVEIVRDDADGGRLQRAAGTVLDITERARAQENERFLAQAGEQLAASLDFDTTLDAIARLVVPAFADWCLLELVDDEGCEERVLVRHSDPRVAAALTPRRDEEAEEGRAVDTTPVLRSPAAATAGDGTSDLAAELSAEPARQEHFRHLGVSAYIRTPLRSGTRTLGMLTIVSSGSGRRYDARDQALIADLARRAALALDNTALHRALAAREGELQDLVGRLLQEQEEERRRVAYDVHDGLAQLAASVHQHLQAFDYQHRPRPPHEQQELDQLLTVTQQTVQEARRVIANLRPIALDDFGLGVALRRQVEHLRARGWHIAYRDGLGGERFPPAIETALFRVAQEALNNIRKHARTTRATIELERSDETVALRVRDEGVGFATDQPRDGEEPGERIGLRGMRERVSLLGGTLQVVSRPGTGTQVAARVPIRSTRT